MEFFLYPFHSRPQNNGTWFPEDNPHRRSNRQSIMMPSQDKAKKDLFFSKLHLIFPVMVNYFGSLIITAYSAFTPAIAKVFYLAGYIEQYGSGTIRMVEWMKEAGLPEPDYKEELSGFSVYFYKDIYIEENLGKMGLNERMSSI